MIKKTIVIGLDGLEPRIVETMLEAGQLPNLAELKRRGGYSRVATTSPAQTPVAWSTFATGVNPGGHGIFDFIRRDPRTYLPDFALNRYEARGAFLPPKAVNLRRGKPVWDLLTEAGLSSTIVRCPCTYPPDPLRGRMLSGMGVPDLRGGLGTATYYTSNDEVKPGESENIVRLPAGIDRPIETYLIGPRNPKGGGDLRFDVTLHPDLDGRRVLLRSAGAPKELEIREGQWSDWIRVKFKLGMLQSVRGLVRFHLVQLEPTLALYASPINFDVETPLFPISQPADYAASLAEDIGSLYHTTGMVEDHAGLNNERFGEDAFLDQCDTAWREREAMLLRELDRFDEGLLYCLFDTPDRVQHLFWRYLEPDHPANQGRAPSPAYAGVIEDQYRRGDEIVGKALQHADDDTFVIVLSDHGFGSFQRGVNLNTLLHDQGLLTLRDGLKPGEEAGDFLKSVDWSKTKAYALGLSGIYLNLEGRESQGIVKPNDVASLKTSIAAGLAGLVDSATNEVAIRTVRPRESVYSGPFVEEAPDLLVNFSRGYRISWGSSLGGVGEGHFEDNRKKWSGDHIVDPTLVPGVLFMNKPFDGKDAALLDLAPTILNALGVPKGAAMEGKSLLAD
ncbi:Type I phosphodiesterase / nucleotide pyrophosphatase [Singulisphaera sp. GP187]|uniref:alkaline phosphatase family protein n=1 Tax=Singulisphaera sp. GP187 TaxID=1882752 RepID=UPI00092A4EEA|nr:alkaline phosphatase family protein [Singulisphaera sp. GP187]SIO64907.1 Type I phosphodiesterase / nucleotide pyrophosphatase [Singulisphaera sp. GP187]